MFFNLAKSRKRPNLELSDKTEKKSNLNKSLPRVHPDVPLFISLRRVYFVAGVMVNVIAVGMLLSVLTLCFLFVFICLRSGRSRFVLTVVRRTFSLFW